MDAGLDGPDAGSKGLDPIVLLDAILGTPDNIGHWIDELLAYSAQPRPDAPQQAGEAQRLPRRPGERLEPLIDARAKALLRKALGDVDGAGDLLERLADAIRAMDESARRWHGSHRRRQPSATSGKGRRPGSPSQ